MIKPISLCSLIALSFVPGVALAVCDETAYTTCVDTAVAACVVANPECVAADLSITAAGVEAAVSAECCDSSKKAGRKGCIQKHKAAFSGKNLKLALGDGFVTEVRDRLSALKSSDCGNNP